MVRRRFAVRSSSVEPVAVNTCGEAILRDAHAGEGSSGQSTRVIIALRSTLYARSTSGTVTPSGVVLDSPSSATTRGHAIASSLAWSSAATRA